MRSAKFFLSIWLCFTVTNAWADMLPFPGGHRPHPPDPYELRQKELHERGPEARSSGVSMDAAEVKVRIKKTQVDGAGGTKIPLLAADVSADFEMMSTAALKSGKEFEVWFPVDVEIKRPPAAFPFSVTVDGKPATDLRELSSYFPDQHGAPVLLWGYAWRLPGLKTGQKQRVSVRYSMVLRKNDGKAHFIYFLRSGAQWEGPIGRETVSVEVEKGLRVKVLSPVVLKPVKSSTASLAWEIVNAKPTEDIALEIWPEVKSPDRR